MSNDIKIPFIILNEENDDSRLIEGEVASTNVLEDKPISNNDIGGMYSLEQCYKLFSTLCVCVCARACTSVTSG